MGITKQAGTGAGGRVIEVTLKQYDIQPKEIRVKKGEKITLRVTSADVSHSLFVGDLDIDMPALKGQIT